MMICSVVVIYYPDVISAINNILKYIDYVDKIIIWNNTPKEHDTGYYIDLGNKLEQKVIRLGEGKNMGIAYALNRSMEWALKNGYGYLLTMDQDSEFIDFSKYVKNVEQVYNIKKNAAIIGPNPNNEYNRDKELLEVPYVITSGSIIDISKIIQIGGFREDYVIDAVDLEICYKASRNSYQVFALTNDMLNQNFGERVYNAIGMSASLYSEFRTYNIIKNHIKLWKEYPKEFTTKWRFVEQYVIKRIIKIIFFDKDKIGALKSIIKGIKDGLSS